MSNPILVDVSRGETIESRHTGAYAVVELTGKVIDHKGDISRAIFPRSAIKVMQALPMIESGAHKAFSITQNELALTLASHNGEVEHARTAKNLLKKASLTENCLECGAHMPMLSKAAYALAKRGVKPTALHNNCSGKHSGFVCTALNLDYDVKGYVKREHPLMQKIEKTMEELMSVSLKDAEWGIDGCSIPTYAVPLESLAKGFARLNTLENAKPLFQAAFNAPFYVAGTGRYDSDVMTALGSKAFIKVGAEGVYCAALPELGLGIALKIDDGAIRAAEALMGSLLRKFLKLSESEAQATYPAPLKNLNGLQVGAIRSTYV